MVCPCQREKSRNRIYAFKCVLLTYVAVLSVELFKFFLLFVFFKVSPVCFCYRLYTDVREFRFVKKSKPLLALATACEGDF